MAIEMINNNPEHQRAHSMDESEVWLSMRSHQNPYLPEPLAYLENEKIWVCFALIPQSNGKIKKLPIDPHTGFLAKINDSCTWGTFKQAKGALTQFANDPGARYKPRLLGFAVIPEIEIVFIDLDHVIDKDTGVVSPAVVEIIEKINSYVEYSQSRAGLHIYAKGHKTSSFCRAEFLEIYDHGRFACITNDAYGEIRPLREATVEIGEICDHYLPKSLPQQSLHQEEHSSVIMEDELILKIAASAKNGNKFKRLYYEGSIAEYGDDASAADQALMDLLVFYTRDEEQLERLFLGSALGQRNKWGRRSDYRKRTIAAALAYVAECYQGPVTISPNRPEIIVSPGNLSIATDEAEQILLQPGTGVFQRGGRLVRVVPAETKPKDPSISRSENAHIIMDVNFTYLIELLTQKAHWISMNSQGKKKETDCPEKISKTSDCTWAVEIANSSWSYSCSYSSTRWLGH